MNSVLTKQTVYGAQFSAILDRLPGHGLVWVDRLRKRAMEQFLDLGFPTTRLENWKYTDVSPIRRIAFQPIVDRVSPPLPETLRLQIEAYAAPRLVFVNGKVDPELSKRAPLRLLSLSEALADTVMVLETVAPFAGLVMETVGGVVSPPLLPPMAIG